ncbi:MAG: proline--tRNA ligase [Alphaproteobacteria bacterium]|nr:proline--tRNA ligase [Alphaproteobacteria bacterium]
MLLNRFFMPTLKEIPAEAQIVSHQMMLRAGMIRQTSSGIYSWLPLGLRVLKKIENIIREEQNKAGCQELLMPTIQSADLWKVSGRYDDYGKEMLRIVDRHDREMLYGPTNEEMITDIFHQSIKSYRELPQLLYHIQWKFRDEVRPRFGVMRGREFLMKDSYSFDLDYDMAKKAYNKMFMCYLRTFARMGLKAIPMQADTGPIGGNLSHEFIILAETGESKVYCDKNLLSFNPLHQHIDYDSDLEPEVQNWTALYAATDEKHDPIKCSVNKENLIEARGIEVGHIFYFGTKYSEPLNAYVTNSQGKEIPVHMGSYGIGVSRLVAAIIEAYHDKAGIIWPLSVAPFDIGLINVKQNDPACDQYAQKVYDTLSQSGFDVLYDNRQERAGSKFSDMDLIGIPWQIVVGPKNTETQTLEIKERATGHKTEISFTNLENFFQEKQKA